MSDKKKTYWVAFNPRGNPVIFYYQYVPLFLKRKDAIFELEMICSGWKYREMWTELKSDGYSIKKVRIEVE